jgi:hypothetical protein
MTMTKRERKLRKIFDKMHDAANDKFVSAGIIALKSEEDFDTSQEPPVSLMWGNMLWSPIMIADILAHAARVIDRQFPGAEQNFIKDVMAITQKILEDYRDAEAKEGIVPAVMPNEADLVS